MAKVKAAGFNGNGTQQAQTLPVAAVAQAGEGAIIVVELTGTSANGGKGDPGLAKGVKEHRSKDKKDKKGKEERGEKGESREKRSKKKNKEEKDKGKEKGEEKYKGDDGQNQKWQGVAATSEPKEPEESEEREKEKDFEPSELVVAINDAEPEQPNRPELLKTAELLPSPIAITIPVAVIEREPEPKPESELELEPKLSATINANIILFDAYAEVPVKQEKVQKDVDAVLVAKTGSVVQEDVLQTSKTRKSFNDKDAKEKDKQIKKKNKKKHKQLDSSSKFSAILEPVVLPTPDPEPSDNLNSTFEVPSNPLPIIAADSPQLDEISNPPPTPPPKSDAEIDATNPQSLQVPVPNLRQDSFSDSDNTPLAHLPTAQPYIRDSPPLASSNISISSTSNSSGILNKPSLEKSKKKRVIIVDHASSSDDDGKSASDSSDISSDESSSSSESESESESSELTDIDQYTRPSIFSSSLRKISSLSLPDTPNTSSTSKRQTITRRSFLGTIASTFTSILEPEPTPEEVAVAKRRRAQDEAIRRQMANNAKFAALQKIGGGLASLEINPTAASLRPDTYTKPSAALLREPSMPIGAQPDSEREFAVGLNHFHNENYAMAAVHWDRAIRIDNNAETLRMLVELHGPNYVPNAGKVAEYSQRRTAVLTTPQGMLNHGRHLARLGNSGLDGPGIVLVRSAADAGSAEAMFEFGMYLRGKGKGGEAMGWLHKAADCGWMQAEEAVAEGYEKGIGVPIDAVAGAAWRARVMARNRVKMQEQSAADRESEAQIAKLRKDAQKREQDRLRIEQDVKQRQEALLLKRAQDPQLNSALRSLDWGFYATAIEQLSNLALLGNVEAKEFLDPDKSVISSKAVSAMFHIGQYHSQNADPASAVKWFRRSAESGYHEAQVTYAAYLIVGKGLDNADPGQAMAWLMKAWESGNNKEAALALGEAYTKGIGVAPDPTKAVKWYTRAWETGGYSEAAFAVGLACATGFTPGAVDPAAWSNARNTSGRQDVNETLNKRSDEKAEIPNDGVVGQDDDDDTNVATVVNLSSSSSSFVPPKPVKSDLVDADAQLSRKNSTRTVSTKTTSPVPSLMEEKKQLNSATMAVSTVVRTRTNSINSPMLKNFSAFRQDVVQAGMWYKKASDLGHSRACNNLGELYMTGRGVSRNDVTGFGLFRRAAMAGLPEAEYNMGRCCREGRGCAKDEEQAVMWFKRAEAQGIKEATKALTTVSGIKE
ncbi:hypothetical protein HK100_012743 [Physocladia obscura]|uniref:Uncharacterized protein n=1 Tax=Physocladia obscura TaxID=109957 RepID=A0AAD5XHE3_9FUNG|nr:hypothetical protein HK100_012743 [Physocladia obscura]